LERLHQKKTGKKPKKCVNKNLPDPKTFTSKGCVKKTLQSFRKERTKCAVSRKNIIKKIRKSLHILNKFMKKSKDDIWVNDSPNSNDSFLMIRILKRTLINKVLTSIFNPSSTCLLLPVELRVRAKLYFSNRKKDDDKAYIVKRPKTKEEEELENEKNYKTKVFFRKLTDYFSEDKSKKHEKHPNATHSHALNTTHLNSAKPHATQQVINGQKSTIAPTLTLGHGKSPCKCNGVQEAAKYIIATLYSVTRKHAAKQCHKKEKKKNKNLEIFLNSHKVRNHNVNHHHGKHKRPVNHNMHHQKGQIKGHLNIHHPLPTLIPSLGHKKVSASVPMKVTWSN